MSNSQATIEVHDPDFHKLLTLPLSCVHHVPPAHLDISRFVLCRNFDAKDPNRSCAMGNSCKFVHADVEGHVLASQSIHVNYAWRDASQVSYERLPAGQTLRVMAPNNRIPCESVPSEYILRTKGALRNGPNATEPLSYCAHYYFNRMCNRGEQCHFIHGVHIDPTAHDFQRAPARARVGAARRVPPALAMVQQYSTATANTHTPRKQMLKRPPTPLAEATSSHSGGSSECGDSFSSRSTVSPVATAPQPVAPPAVLYRHNPYSLVHVTVPTTADHGVSFAF